MGPTNISYRDPQLSFRSPELSSDEHPNVRKCDQYEELDVNTLLASLTDETFEIARLRNNDRASPSSIAVKDRVDSWRSGLVPAASLSDWSEDYNLLPNEVNGQQIHPPRSASNDPPQTLSSSFSPRIWPQDNMVSAYGDPENYDTARRMAAGYAQDFDFDSSLKQFKTEIARKPSTASRAELPSKTKSQERASIRSSASEVSVSRNPGSSRLRQRSTSHSLDFDPADDENWLIEREDCWRCNEKGLPARRCNCIEVRYVCFVCGSRYPPNAQFWEHITYCGENVNSSDGLTCPKRKCKTVKKICGAAALTTHVLVQHRIAYRMDGVLQHPTRPNKPFSKQAFCLWMYDHLHLLRLRKSQKGQKRKRVQNESGENRQDPPAGNVKDTPGATLTRISGNLEMELRSPLSQSPEIWRNGIDIAGDRFDRNSAVHTGVDTPALQNIFEVEASDRFNASLVYHESQYSSCAKFPHDKEWVGQEAQCFAAGHFEEETGSELWDWYLNNWS